MKYYEVVEMRTGTYDEWVKYTGTNLEKAKESFNFYAGYIPKGDFDCKIEIREYEVPENWDELDEYEQADAICDIAGYNIVADVQGDKFIQSV